MHSGDLGALGEATLSEAEKNALLQVMQRAKVSSACSGKDNDFGAMLSVSRRAAGIRPSHRAQSSTREHVRMRKMRREKERVLVVPDDTIVSASPWELDDSTAGDMLRAIYHCPHSHH